MGFIKKFFFLLPFYINLSGFLAIFICFACYVLEREKMAKKFIFIFLASTLLTLSSGVDVKGEARKSLSEVNQKLKLLNKPAVKSIKVYFSNLTLNNVILSNFKEIVNSQAVLYMHQIASLGNVIKTIACY
jgi:hypothetical protein